MVLFLRLFDDIHILSLGFSFFVMSRVRFRLQFNRFIHAIAFLHIFCFLVIVFLMTLVLVVLSLIAVGSIYLFFFMVLQEKP